MKEKKLRIEDALSATRAAVEEGIVAGGGAAFVDAIPQVAELVNSLSGDEKTGAMIIQRHLKNLFARSQSMQVLRVQLLLIRL